MLLSKEVKIKWNAKIKKHYVDLGYSYTKMTDEFYVNVCDLTNGSSAIVEVKCDYCNENYFVKWESYLKCKNKSIIKKDCCGNPRCTGQKAHESLMKKYGVNSIWEIDEIREKRDKTNIEKYGCKNPFGNDDIKQKIKQYNLDNYGVEYSMQRPDVVKKSQETCLNKYGVINYGKIYSETHSGELSSVWKGDDAITRRDGRELPQYRKWRKSIYDRDLYTCQCCGIKSRKGVSVNLEAHHIYDWKNHVDKRYDVDNGITFCDKCHQLFHSIFGKKGNDLNQLNEFLDKYKTVI